MARVDSINRSTRPGHDDPWQTTRQTHFSGGISLLAKINKDMSVMCEKAKKLIYQAGYTIDGNGSEKCMILASRPHSMSSPA